MRELAYLMSHGIDMRGLVSDCNGKWQVTVVETGIIKRFGKKIKNSLIISMLPLTT